MSTRPPVDPGPTSPLDTLQALIDLTGPEDPTYPTLLLRLGDESLAEADRRRFELLELERSGGPTGGPTAAELKRQVEHLEQRAIDAYGKLASDRRFEPYARRDDAVLALARLHQRRNEPDAMRRAVLVLIRDHPASAHVPAAYVLLADWLFDEGKLDQAERVYDKVLQFPDPRQQAYAHYKLAWCRYNPYQGRASDPTAALEHFVRAIETAPSDAPGAVLRRAARRDLIFAYADAGRPRRAKAFFERVGRGPDPDEDHVRFMLERLMTRYADLGRVGDADLVRAQLTKARN